MNYPSESFPSNMIFQLWDMTVSHGYLNIRHAVVTDSGPSNIDIVFRSVEYMEVAKFLGGLSFTEPKPQEVQYLESRCMHKEGKRNYYVLISNNQRYYIVASSVYLETNSLPLGKSAIMRDFEKAAEAELHDG